MNNISKQVKNYNELCKYLIIDLDENSKKNIDMSKSIEIMGKNVFLDTINTIEKFLNDKSTKQNFGIIKKKFNFNFITSLSLVTLLIIFWEKN